MGATGRGESPYKNYTNDARIAIAASTRSLFLGDRPQVTSPEAAGNEEKPLSGGAGTQYPPYKANLNVD